MMEATWYSGKRPSSHPSVSRGCGHGAWFCLLPGTVISDEWQEDFCSWYPRALARADCMESIQIFAVPNCHLLTF